MAVSLFETERLSVRPFEPDDLDVFAALCAEPRVMRYVGDGQGLPRDRVAYWIEVCQQRYTQRGYGTSAVFVKDTGKFIGYCGVVRPVENDFDELIYVFNVAAWGKGYATEVGRRMLDYVFERSSLDRIYATIHPDNAPSIHAAQKMGFTFDRVERDEDGSPTEFHHVDRPSP